MQTEENPSIAEMKIAIATDVIAQVKAEKYYASKGVYFASTFTSVDPIKGELQEHLDDVLADGCQVCALGGIFLSKVRLFDNASIDDLNALRYDYNNEVYKVAILSHRMEDNLEEIFGREQLKMIEAAFEGWDNVGSQWRYLCPADRMIAIMENIIAHHGVFTP